MNKCLLIIPVLFFVSLTLFNCTTAGVDYNFIGTWEGSYEYSSNSNTYKGNLTLTFNKDDTGTLNDKGVAYYPGGSAINYDESDEFKIKKADSFYKVIKFDFKSKSYLDQYYSYNLNSDTLIIYSVPSYGDLELSRN
jgi:hypothetical protein